MPPHQIQHFIRDCHDLRMRRILCLSLIKACDGLKIFSYFFDADRVPLPVLEDLDVGGVGGKFEEGFAGSEGRCREGGEEVEIIELIQPLPL